MGQIIQLVWRMKAKQMQNINTVGLTLIHSKLQL